jgi:thiol-disulfide isomerase/thioredoxin
MTHTKKKNKKLNLLIAVLIIIAVGFIFRNEIKIKVVSTFASAQAQSERYHILQNNSEIQDIAELVSPSQKAIFIVKSSWCSSCEAVISEMKALLPHHVDTIVYEIDLDQFRGLLTEYGAAQAPTAIVFQNGEVNVERSLRVNNVSAVFELDL